MPETSLQTTLPSSHFILPSTNSTSSRRSSSFSLCQWVFFKWVWALNCNYFAWNWIPFPNLLWRVSGNKATWHPWSEGTPLASSQLSGNLQFAHHIVSLFNLYFISRLTLLSHLLFLPTLTTSKCISASKFSLGLFFFHACVQPLKALPGLWQHSQLLWVQLTSTPVNVLFAASSTTLLKSLYKEHWSLRNTGNTMPFSNCYLCL